MTRPTAPGLRRRDVQEGLRREFTFGSAFSLAFAFISPIIALYAIFALALGTSGPSFWWAFPVVLLGQTLVAIVLAELSSRWPMAGGLFQWARLLVGPRYGWATAWTYIWTLITLNVAGAYACSVFAARLLGVTDPSTGLRLALALGLLLLSTLPNIAGRRAVKVFVGCAIVCEAVGSLVVGTILLTFHRKNDLSIVLQGAVSGEGSFAFGPFLAAVAIVGWAFVGFESAADIAEEVKEPERAVPKALIASLVVVALTVMYAGLALILAIPDVPAAVAGEVADPVSATISAALGPSAVAPVMLVVCVGFVAGMAAVGAAVSRVVYALARDRDLPASRFLSRLSTRDRVPVNAAGVISAVAAALLILAVVTGLYDTLITISTGGFYLAFTLPVLAMLVSRWRGRWIAGPFRLGTALSPVVNLLAAVWLVFETVNIVWPRPIGAPWYVEWGCPLMFAAIALTGLAVRGAVSRRA